MCCETVLMVTKMDTMSRRCFVKVRNSLYACPRLVEFLGDEGRPFRGLGIRRAEDESDEGHNSRDATINEEVRETSRNF